MTKRMKPEERRKCMAALWRTLIISAATVASAYALPRAAKALDARLQDADYAEEHAAIKDIRGILEERAINEVKYGTKGDKPDAFEESLKRELKFREKRHAREKKNAKCRYCEQEVRTE